MVAGAVTAEPDQLRADQPPQRLLGFLIGATAVRTLLESGVRRHRSRTTRFRSSFPRRRECRSEEHTSELQSLMRTSYAAFCLKKKTNRTQTKHNTIAH